MKKISNWKTVFCFTFKQIFNRKGFKIATFLGAFLIFALVAVVALIVAKPAKEEKSKIENVIVLDKSGYLQTDYGAYIQAMQDAEYSDITFEYADSGLDEESLFKRVVDDKNTIIMKIIKNEDRSCSMTAVIAEGSDISENTAEAFLKDMTEYFEMNKLSQAGLTEQQLTQAMAPVVTSVYELDESADMIIYLVRIFAPMLFGLILYFMLLFHGQTICTEVSAEKTSKLMESLLTYCHPYALISGKILAVTVLSVMQFLIWAVSAVAGLAVGGFAALMLFEVEAAPVEDTVVFLQQNLGSTAFSPVSIIMALIIFFMGLLFYNVLAGVAGSMVARPEDASTTQSLFQFPVIISFLVSYLSFLMDKKSVLMVIRYVPFTSPFCVPVELITGNVGVVEGLISMVLLIVFSVLTISVSAVIYKGLVLYNGQKINVKTIINVLKSR